MVNSILVQLIFFLFITGLYAKVDRVYQESYLGEKKLEAYSDRYQPLIFQDIYQGKLYFRDEDFYQNFFRPYLFQDESDYSFFLRSELGGAMACPNELLSKHFDEIRFSYRLVALSYLIEGQWHMKLTSDQLKLKNGCDFDLRGWIRSCNPKSPEMKKFLQRMEEFGPKYGEHLPTGYSREQWMREFRQDTQAWYSQYRIGTDCQGKCSEEEALSKFGPSCKEDQSLMTLICSEEDEIYGLSSSRDAYYLLGLSNIINTFNGNGEALGCMRRFSETMSHKEVRYRVFGPLFPVIQSFLRHRYQERFLQGRVFFYGSGKEFEAKGLKNLYVKEQPLKLEKLPMEPLFPKDEAPLQVEAKVVEKPLLSKPVEVAKPVTLERKTFKSAFLLASELRSSQNLDRVEVDMLKLKYDYVFSLNMINTLSKRLASFMTREALAEMVEYDKLGTKDSPVPLLFIKYMIDMQEHHGLWNVLSVLGDKFYVVNEIDAALKPDAERIQLVNGHATGGQWQIYIVKP